jgi:hypothetical protein
MSRAQHLSLIRAIGDALERLPEDSSEQLSLVDAMGDEVGALLSQIIDSVEHRGEPPKDDNDGRRHLA